MPLTNAFLIRAAYGWDEATDSSSIYTYGRREALYGLGSYTSAVDVARTANARLALISTPRYQYDAEQDTTATPDADFAYHGYGVGDTLPVTEPGGSPNSERVQSIAVSEDQDNGRAFVTASLHDIVMYASPIDNFLAMLATATKKMIPGTGRGDWPEAQPVTPPGVIVAASASQPQDPCCGYTVSGISLYAELPSGPATSHFFEYYLPTTNHPCSGDMRMTMKVTEFTTDTGGDAELELQVRVGGPSGPGGVYFTMNEIGGGGNGTYAIGTFVGGDITTSILPKPVAGDVLALQIVGDTATAYRNGSVLFNEVIPGVTVPVAMQPIAAAVLDSGGFGAGPYIQRADVSFSSYCS